MNNNNNDQEGHFYKGLFFGLILGVGLIWFLNSDTGKDLVKQTRKKIDEALSTDPGMEDYDEEGVEETAEVEGAAKSDSSLSPKRFFKKKEK